MFVCVRVCVCMFCLFTPFLSVLLAGQNLKRDGQGGGNIGGRGGGAVRKKEGGGVRGGGGGGGLHKIGGLW